MGQRFRLGPRKRVLIVNAFLDEYRRTRGSPNRVPRAMGPVYLAGAFDPALWQVELWNEQYSGLLADLGRLRDLDMLVLTGVTAALDRMRQLTAYARTLSPEVVVAAGGPAVRALPKLTAGIFDYACRGDIEELQAAVADAFGYRYASAEMFPRYDLPYGGGMIGYVESSRNCNFRCSFCALTGEKGRYRTYDLDFVRRQIEAVGKRQICFIDNNFYGNDRDFFRAKVELCGGLWREGRIDGWSCLVTGDFFAEPENLRRVAAAGCQGIFSGVESFDAATLAAYRKRQNTIVPQVRMIRDCLEAGVLFTYGIMLDPSSRPVAQLRDEIEFILAQPEITLPAFFTLAIPLLGTPYFRQCVEGGLFLPNTLLRNLDGVTLTMRPRDDIETALDFVSGLTSLRGYRRKVLDHNRRFLWRYRRTLTPLQLCASSVMSALIATEAFAISPTRRQGRRVRPSYYGPSQQLDDCYRPAIRVPSRYEPLFRPIRITDADGGPHPDIALDSLDHPERST